MRIYMMNNRAILLSFTPIGFETTEP